MHPREIVRTGYNRIGKLYAATRRDDSEDVKQLQLLMDQLPKGAAVLDVGYGSGEPVARLLARSFQVTGETLSRNCFPMARRTIPGGTFICGEITHLSFRDRTFDAVVSYYVICHNSCSLPSIQNCFWTFTES